MILDKRTIMNIKYQQPDYPLKVIYTRRLCFRYSFFWPIYKIIMPVYSTHLGHFLTSVHLVLLIARQIVLIVSLDRHIELSLQIKSLNNCNTLTKLTNLVISNLDTIHIVMYSKGKNRRTYWIHQIKQKYNNRSTFPTTQPSYESNYLTCSQK